MEKAYLLHPCEQPKAIGEPRVGRPWVAGSVAGGPARALPAQWAAQSHLLRLAVTESLGFMKGSQERHRHNHGPQRCPGHSP